MLSVGDKFPELHVESREGDVALSDRWRDGPLIVAFMRHFGWPFCREQLVQLGEHHEEIREAGADVIAIFQYRADPTYHFCRKRGVPFDCFGDPDREAYHAVGLERGSVREYIGPQLAKGFLRAARHGALAGNPQGGDVAQRPATFVVSPEGMVLYAHYNRDSADHPPIDEILATVQAGARQS